MADLGALSFSLGLDTSTFDTSLASALSGIQSIGTDATTSAGNVASIGTNAGTAAGNIVSAFTRGDVVSAVTQLGDMIWDLAVQAAAVGDNIDKSSAKLGFSTAEYQRWDSVLRHCGTTTTVMSMALSTMSSKMNGSSAKQFNADLQSIGLSIDQLSGMTRAQQFEAVTRGLMSITKESERLELAQKLMGTRAQQQLGALLKMTPEALDELFTKYDALNIEIGQGTIEKTVAFTDAMQELGDAWQTLKTTVGGEFAGTFVPFIQSVSQMIGALNSLAKGDLQGLFTGLIAGMSDFVGSLTMAIAQPFLAILRRLGLIKDEEYDVSGAQEAENERQAALRGVTYTDETMAGRYAFLAGLQDDNGPISSLMEYMLSEVAQKGLKLYGQHTKTALGDYYDELTSMLIESGGYDADTAKTIADNILRDLQKYTESNKIDLDASPELVNNWFEIVQGQVGQKAVTLDAYLNIVGASSGGDSSGDIPGHATGLDFVPYDEYGARLHRGEAVLTASEASEWRKNGASGKSIETVESNTFFFGDVHMGGDRDIEAVIAELNALTRRRNAGYGVRG